MSAILRGTLPALLLALALPATAIDTGPAFEDPELQARYERLIEEVRCLKCQNQNLRDSNAFLAADLRREIRRLIADGKSDEEIYDFLVSRYGEFALYKPRLQGKTLILWIMPGLLVVVGVVMIGSILRKRTALPVDDADTDTGADR